MIRVFYDILFDARLCGYCSASGIQRDLKEGQVARPALDIRKREAIHSITLMAGFQKTFSQFNQAMNNVLNKVRKDFNIPSSTYDGKNIARIQRYNDDEEVLAQNRETKYYETRLIRQE